MWEETFKSHTDSKPNGILICGIYIDIYVIYMCIYIDILLLIKSFSFYSITHSV